MSQIFILVERHEEGWTATARDECGQVDQPVTRRDRAAAIDAVKRQTAEFLGVPCAFTIDGLGGRKGVS